MNSTFIAMLTRYAMIGSGLLGLGIEAGQQQTIIDALTSLVGAAGTAVTAIGILWGVYVNWKTRIVPEHVGERSTVPTVSPITGQVQK